jgi:hypothetical protein
MINGGEWMFWWNSEWFLSDLISTAEIPMTI